MRRALLLVVLIAAAAAGGFVAGSRSTSPGPAGIAQHAPGPGDPPSVWVAGRITTVSATEVTIQQGDGPVIRMQRLAGGATGGFEPSDGAWVEDPSLIREGVDACIEALLDDGAYVALRVFVRAGGCGPA